METASREYSQRIFAPCMTTSRSSGVRFRATMIALVLVLSFMQGLFKFVGIPTIAVRGGTEVLVFLLLATAALVRGKDFRGRGYLAATCLFLTALVSWRYNGSGVLGLALFYHLMLMFYLFYLALTNLQLRAGEMRFLDRLVVILFLIQIPASFVKFALVGVKEGQGIGTMSVSSGSLTTVFTIVAFPVTFGYFLVYRRRIYVVVMAGFFLFGLIGEKRGIVFFLPFMLAFVLFFYLKLYLKRRRVFISPLAVRYGLLAVIVACAALYLTARSIYSLNPDGRAGGRFDLAFLWDKAIGYTTQADEYVHISNPVVRRNAVAYGRLASLTHSIPFTCESGVANALLGFGPGCVIQSSLTAADDDQYEEMLALKFGIGKHLVGMAWLFLQTGLLGSLAVFALYGNFFALGIRKMRTALTRADNALALAFLTINIALAMDFLTYSTVGIGAGVITPVYFYLAFRMHSITGGSAAHVHRA